MSALDALPDLVPLPADAHETLVAVGALLGPAAKLTERHGPGEYTEDDSGFGCGCEIRFEHRGAMWTFHRGDATWALIREQDGQVLHDGSTVHTRWYELGATGSTARREYLVTLIRAELDETSRSGPPLR
ncbi:hypothetical protein [Streptomyces sp. NPDC096339]|uniref:hypothetical protein n=1 Tax=Streptomyces sp. NPDC096339 TaxID=3366086 RepID=UPI003823187E